ncbi:alpha/beta hydrolase [Subtercola sp. Z020]|uniref:alpha/beta fold hydrolase n=1 Tax=Subtercola sp. Z020 TaxID=2080582 RepID=UPI000CE8C51F|nr:alpha/beta hydrolase [Subtercola sp. Z020]PPF78802.1 alpha/beta hydrolase [Subtercola sp. Z020]
MGRVAGGRELSIDGLPFRVWQSPHKGRMSRPVFVIVHGIGSSHRYGVRLQNELAAHGEALSLDLPGFGGLARPRHPLSIEEYATLLGHLFDALHLPEAVLVGHSMGAQIITELAVQRPELVTHLVLVGPVVNPGRGSGVQQALDLARDSAFEPGVVKRTGSRDAMRAGLRWFLAEMRPMLAYPLRARLARVGVPVLVVRGADDPIARLAWCNDLAGSVPGARLLNVQGHRHVVHLTAPRNVAAGILRLVRSAAAVPAAGAVPVAGAVLAAGAVPVAGAVPSAGAVPAAEGSSAPAPEPTAAETPGPGEGA